jgi:2-polyprenyl-3-methyl-5-hydroxy-6-metoxy-1,4-benzoquinol methylase
VDPRLKQHRLGFWEVSKKPTPIELQKYYADKYYQEGMGSYDIEYSSDELAYFKSKLEQRMGVIQQYFSFDATSKSLLDVGCGEGYALSFFREKGWNVRGFDFSSAGVKSKNPSCLDVLETGDVFELLRSEIDTGRKYDIVWLQNVLEHVIDPINLLQSLRKLVSPNGIAVLTVPNDCSITQMALLNNHHIDSAFWVAPPDHLSYFDCESLKSVTEFTGWECVELLSDFPVDWFLFNPNSNYVNNRNVGKDAHRARVQIENLIHKQPIEDVLNFWSAAAKLGIGRDITAFLKPTRGE